MSTGIYSRRQNFDNLSYTPDASDRVSYVNTGHEQTGGIVLQAKNLKKVKRENPPNYVYQSGRDQIYAYNNAAFSDISGTEGPSIRSQHSNLYALQKQFGATHSHGKVYGICSKYWYIFALVTIVILVGIGLGIGLGVFYSRDRSTDCDLVCGPGEKLVQINSTHCECHFINECEYQPPVCGQFPCKKFNGPGYECECTTGFQHPPLNHDLTHCEDIDECENMDACGEHQLCNNTIGSYHCSCELGYETQITNNGIVCQDLDECNGTNPCTNGICKNTNGSFECICNSGFQLNPFDPYHCEDKNECYSYNCTGEHEVCLNTLGSYQCICDRGYTRDASNHCINIDECSQSSNMCDSNSRCEDRDGSYACCIQRISNECIECGYDYTSVVNSHSRRTRMIDGEFVEQGHFPWIAALFINKNYIDSDLRYVCSASIVSSWNIITAAHCLDEHLVRSRWPTIHWPNSFKDLFDIRLGVYNLSMNSTEYIQSESYLIENFTIHSGYESLHSDEAMVKNDLAVIKLNKRIERSTTIDWICLPTIVNVHDQSVLRVVSYGSVNEQLVQQQLSIRVLQNQIECQRQISDIAEDAFCAISTSSTSFLGLGDSGAGAMIFLNNRWQLAGIMSKTGNTDKAYSAMTNVSMHIDWLQSLVER